MAIGNQPSSLIKRQDALYNGEIVGLHQVSFTDLTKAFNMVFL